MDPVNLLINIFCFLGGIAVGLIIPDEYDKE